MPDQVQAALIAGIVSLVVSLLTLWSQRRKVTSEETRHARDHQRRLTERLLDLRLTAYRKAFGITHDLTGQFLLADRGVSREHLAKVKESLVEWQRTDGAFLFTKLSLQTYRDLVRALSDEPREDGIFSRKQRDHIWRCKNRFRGALKSDLKLLYEEDNVEQSDALDEGNRAERASPRE